MLSGLAAANAGALDYEPPARVVVVAPLAPPEVIDQFQGFYLGLQVKTVIGSKNSFVYDVDTLAEDVRLDLSGFGYGAYAGYGITFGANQRLFVAAEVNAQAFVPSDVADCHGDCASCNGSLNNIVSARIRLGMLVGQNANTLLYIHGGPSSANVTAGANWAGDPTYQTNGTVSGITYGAGIEYAISTRAKLRVEYSINDLDDFSFSAIGRNHTANFSNDEVAVGVSFTF